VEVFLRSVTTGEEDESSGEEVKIAWRKGWFVEEEEEEGGKRC